MIMDNHMKAIALHMLDSIDGLETSVEAIFKSMIEEDPVYFIRHVIKVWEKGNPRCTVLKLLLQTYIIQLNRDNVSRGLTKIKTVKLHKAITKVSVGASIDFVNEIFENLQTQQKGCYHDT